MTWTRLARTELAYELLLGKPISDPEGWYPRREYPEPGSKRERAARTALAMALRKGDRYFIDLVAAMIHPRPQSAIIKQKIEFAPSKDKRRETKPLDRRDLDIAVFIHEWRAAHAGSPVQAAIAEAADHFGFAERIIWAGWKKYRPVTADNR
jgi:hypothetical protein